MSDYDWKPVNGRQPGGKVLLIRWEPPEDKPTLGFWDSVDREWRVVDSNWISILGSLIDPPPTEYAMLEPGELQEWLGRV